MHPDIACLDRIERGGLYTHTAFSTHVLTINVPGFYSNEVYLEHWYLVYYQLKMENMEGEEDRTTTR
jgi:hypothetical protein